MIRFCRKEEIEENGDVLAKTARQGGPSRTLEMGGERQGNGLFDLRKDLSEKKDLSTEHPDILKKLKDRFANWKKEMAAAEPREPFRDY